MPSEKFPSDEEKISGSASFAPTDKGQITFIKKNDSAPSLKNEVDANRKLAETAGREEGQSAAIDKILKGSPLENATIEDIE